MKQISDFLLSGKHAPDEMQLNSILSLMDVAQEGIHILDDKGRVIAVNSAFCKLLGYSAEEFSQMNVTDWDTKLTPEQLKQMFPDLLEGRSTFESQYKCKDGGVIDVEINAVGTVLKGRKCLYVATRDISRRKLIETKLKQQERYQRTLLDNFPFAVWLKDTKGRNLAGNTKFAMHCGYGHLDSVIGKRDSELFPQDIAESFRKTDKIVIDTREQYCGEDSLLVDDQLRCFETRKMPVIDEQGVVIGIVGYARDITEHRRIDESLLEAENKLRIIFETMTEGVALNEAIFDEHGDVVDYRIIEVNKAFYKTADYRGGSVVGQLATNLYYLSSDVIKSFWDSHRNSTVVRETEFFSPLVNRYFIISTSPLVNGRFVTSFFDITDRKNAEMAIHENEHFLRTVSDSIPGMLSYWTTDQRCCFANQGLQNWFSRSREEMLGIHVSELLGEEKYRIYEPQIRGALGGEDQIFERLVIKQNGEVNYLLFQLICHRVEEQIKGFFVLVTDLSELKLAEARLREVEHTAEDRLKVIRQLENHSKDMNTTLSTLIRNKESLALEDKAALSQALNQVVVPFLKQLKIDSGASKQKALISVIEANLHHLISSYSQPLNFSSVAKLLSPKEMQIASMIRQGLSSKEIASTLSLSTDTVSNHRKSIRKKLDLKTKAENLQTKLASL